MVIFGVGSSALIEFNTKLFVNSVRLIFDVDPRAAKVADTGMINRLIRAKNLNTIENRFR